VIGSAERNGGHDDQHLVICSECHGSRVMVGPSYAKWLWRCLDCGATGNDQAAPSKEA
jgi:hypothetical protein